MRIEHALEMVVVIHVAAHFLDPLPCFVPVLRQEIFQARSAACH